ncbi:MAG: hypothetical protein RIT81_14390 [Deltaproteobacteria bacterium]
MNSIHEWLEANARDVLDDDHEAEGPHIEDTRFAKLVDAAEVLTQREIRHLGRCGACRAVAGSLLETVPARPEVEAEPWWSRWWRPVPLSLAAAALAGLVFVVARSPDTLQTRGNETRDFAAPTVAILAKGADGWRVTDDGQSVALGARLGFRYGNVAGAAKTITVLAYDGARLHWFYPEKAGEPAQALETGEDAVNVRLPYDIVLDDEHRAGELTIAIGFDVEPVELASRLKAGEIGDTRSTFVRRLTVKEATP